MGPSVSTRGEFSRESPPSALPTVGSHAFRLMVEELGSTLHLRLAGEFDLAGIGRVEAALERISSEHTRQVIFDLTDLSFLDSAGPPHDPAGKRALTQR